MVEKELVPDLKDEERRLEKVDASPDSSTPQLADGELRTVDNGARDVTEVSPADARRILRKIDYRLVPLLAFLYLVAFVDRSNSTFLRMMKSYA
jgi:hypothetical protein